MESHTVLVGEMKNWCRGEGLQEDHALMVIVPETTEITAIEEALGAIKVLGRVRVRGRMFSAKLGGMMVLCESKEKINADSVPPEVHPGEGQEAWPIVIISERAVTDDDFSVKVTSLLQAEGKTVEDVQALFPGQSPAPSSTEAILRAVGDLLDKAAKPAAESGSYRRLRIFSGTLPTPAGEESFDHWSEQANLMVAESDCPEKEKRRRIMESVKGPAMEILKAVRLSDPDVSPERCIEALESAFGTAESGDDLYFSFRLMQQQSGEKLSDFLRRLERSLTKVVQRGGLPASQMDRARVEQLLRGAVTSDLMLIRLRLRERKTSPPNFLELLSEIRSEEEYEASRAKLNPSVHSIHVKQDVEGKQAEIQTLKADIKEIKSMFAALATRPQLTEPERNIKAPAEIWHAPEKEAESEVAALKKQVKRLQQKLNNKRTNIDTPAAVMAVATSRPDQNTSRRFRNDPDEHFCYKCGEPGHIAGQCRNPENPNKVIRKLIQSLKKAKDACQPTTDELAAKNVVCNAKRSAVDLLRPKNIPPGLIGPPSIEPVRVNGHPCDALLDSGSQVTIIFEQWYSKNLSDVPIYPVEGLDIWGLSESECTYPYRGYVVVEMEFPKKVVGTPAIIAVLALICPTPRGPDQTPIIVGTNAKASLPQRLAKLSEEISGEDTATTLSVQGVVTAEKSESSNLDIEEEDQEVGQVKWLGPGSLSLPPGVSHLVDASVEFSQPVGKEILMLDVSPTDPLPAGVLLQPMVVPRYALDSSKVTLLLQNESLKEVLIPVGTILGHLFLTDIVTNVPKSDQSTDKFDASQIDFGDSPIPESWKNRLRDKLARRSDVFSLDEWDVGLAKDVEHSIRLADDRPFRERSRRLAPADIDDVRRHLQELLAAGIIKESRSPYASPIVIARKKNGKVRMCIDYRTLNRRTIPDQYTTPRIDDALDCLSGSRWFTVLDLRSGYYQIPMKEQDKEKTAFICPLGFYQFERMPQGITGAPATFQRLMEKAVGDMNLLQVLVYLDDLIVFGRTLEEHEERLLKVLDRLREVGLKISIDKCQFCQPSVKYVGHIVSAEGVATDPAKIEAVTTWPQPTDLKSLRSFLGFCGYYRRFIANYSSIVRPLTDLTKGYAPTQRGKKSAKEQKTYLKETEPFGERWDQECIDAFHKIIYCLTHAPVLAFADPNKPYVLHVDACLSGLGAVLYQEYPEGLKPVAFASRKLTVSEKNYPIHQLEFLSLKWAVVDKFHDYLYGARFTVRTDNNPLTYVLTTAKLNATGHRWLASLSTYNFDILYRPGRHNVDADLLSRQETEEWETIPLAGVQSICKRAVLQNSNTTSPTYVEQLGATPESIPDIFAFPTRLDVCSLGQLTRSEIVDAQASDAVIGPAIQALRQGRWSQEVAARPELAVIKKEMGKLAMKDGLLHRLSKKQSGEEVAQLVLPEVFRSTVLKSMHDDFGHLGLERTLDLIRARVYWPKMAVDIEQYIKNCGECITRKTPGQRASPLHQIVSSGPMDLVCIDFLSVEPDSKGVANVLVITDHFTRYAQAFPARNQKAHTVAKILVEKFFVHYGLPARIHSDQGRDFESRLIREMLKMMGIRKSRTTPYHPQGDPQPERFNRTLLSMLGTLSQEKRKQWSQHIPYLVHAYNSTKCDATGFSPYFLMFGREARLPVDLCFGTSPDGSNVGHHLRYVAKLREDLKKAFQLASAAADKTHLRNKRSHDKRVVPWTLEPGDRVLLKNLGLKGKHKLQSRWSAVPYEVVEKLPNLPVYRIRPESGNGCLKTFHRDHLLPIGQLVRMPKVEDENKLLQKPKTRADTQKKQRKVLQPSIHEQEDTDLSSDSSVDCRVQRPHRTYKTYLDRFLQKRARRDGLDSNDEEPAPVREEYVEEERDSQGEDEDQEQGSDAGEETGPESETASEGEPVSGLDVRDISEPQVRPKRRVKPVVRLTYDEPGKARDQPITIVHRGIVIRIGK
ncbi:uncharacterized protein LOC118471094 [Amphiprion ocellaris]|uniref:uncharacterized protein LOC118471094 n=1 Tax=Amphiprion ocellaris TaxID=80972 RepID=UPI0024111A2F|nr:uncharacterized protein LOC118471094 [Amphiprion ocellaris]